MPTPPKNHTTFTAVLIATTLTTPILAPTPPPNHHTPTIAHPTTWNHYTTQKPNWNPNNCTPITTHPTTTSLHIECANIRTPLDHTNLTKGPITIHLTRVRATQPPPPPNHTRTPTELLNHPIPPKRTLIVNPGGPGAPAAWLAPALATKHPNLLTTHDIIAIDPRGSDNSTPIHCPTIDDGYTELRNAPPTQITNMQKAVRTTVHLCNQQQGHLLPYLSTTATAHDIDLTRRILNTPTIDFYGISAGTWLGATYARLHPLTTGRFILDGNTQFTTTWRNSFAQQPHGFQRRLEQQFLPWLARHHTTYHLGNTPHATKTTYTTIRTAIANGHIPNTTPRAFDQQTITNLYSNEGFLNLAQQLTTLKKHTQKTPPTPTPNPPPQPTQRPATPEDTLYNAIQCNDTPHHDNEDSYAHEGQALGRAYPLIGWEWLTNPCAYWPTSPTPTPNTPLPPLLMIQAELDPATPLEGALTAHRAEPATRMIGIEDEGSHGTYLQGNPCATPLINTYLTTGKLPATDIVCPGTPLPNENRLYPVLGDLHNDLNP